MIYIIIIVAIIIIIYFAAKQAKKNSLNLKNEGLNEKELIKSGKYIHGHPDLDKPVLITKLGIRDKELCIVSMTNLKVMAIIPIEFIKNITIEDASTMERRVTAGRMLMFGVFAFGMKKKTKTEMAYLVLNWQTGKFENDTIFEFTGFGAITAANSARNKLIKVCN